LQASIALGILISFASDFLFFFLMGHVASHFVPLDPNLEAENELLALVPQLMAELMKGAGLRPPHIFRWRKNY